MDKKPGPNSGTAAEFSENLIAPAALAGLLNLLDPERCTAWLFDFLHPGAAAHCCPGCGAKLSERRALSYARFRKVACSACGLQFRATTGTALHHCQLTQPEIILAAGLTEAGADAAAVALALGRGWDTAKIWQGRLEGLQRGGQGKRAGENTPETG
ncbi:hypothetical protein [Desulfuromonas thiophila]|uniref:hypothetical protein n=1 Tax=Desulfuromonas thiophila TaxID=57664 RepID=UPI0024A9E413|nr:hypothetical protein [Desulfuromonas thiophila]